jgi:hypothetical protein
VDDTVAAPSDDSAMTLTDYAIDIALISLVVLQVRGRRLTVRNALLPVVLVGWAAATYLHGIPTAGNDLILVGGAAATGILLGVLCGLFTSVGTGSDGRPFAKAGAAAAVLWVMGVGTRLAFQLFATHGGAGAIRRFSAAHHVTSSEAWVAALILMAMGEALARTAVLAARAYSVAPEHFFGRTGMIGASDRAY